MFAIGAGVELGRSVFVSLWEQYVVLPNSFPPPPALPEGGLYLVQDLGAFLISPCLLFALYYKFGKGVDLAATLRAASVSLFLGGGVGAVLTILSTAVIYDRLDSLASYFASWFTDGWVFGQVVVAIASAGLFTLFVGISAVVIATRGSRVQSPPLEEPAEPSP